MCLFKKLLTIISLLLIPVLGLCIYYASADWGLSSRLPEAEAARRMALIRSAENWLGCKEEDGSHKQIIDLYNTQESLPMDYEVTYTDSWCATFVSAAAMQAGLTDVIPLECGCERQIHLLQDRGLWVEQDTYFPIPGDLIYYAWDEDFFGDCTGWADHVGIVTGTRWPFVKVLEGNKDDTVDYRIVSIWNPTIRGYGVPNYQEIP